MAKQNIENIVDITLEYSIYGLLFFIPISIAAIEAFFGIAFTAFLVKKILKPDFAFLKNGIYTVLLIFLLFNALSLFNSGNLLIKSLKALFFKWSEFVLMFMVVGESLNTKKRLRNALLVLLFSLTLISVDCIIQQLTGTDFIRKNLLNTTGFITASFKNQNSLSAYLNVGLILVMSMLFMPRIKNESKIPLFVLFLAALTCLFLTQCRGAWLGFFAGLLIFSVISENYTIFIVFIFIFAVTLALVPSLMSRIIKTFIPGGDADRFALARVAWSMIKEHPVLGRGLGTFMDHFHEYSMIKEAHYAHNSFLQIWAEAGIFSLLSFLGFLGLFFAKAIKTFKKNKDFILLGITCGLFAFVTHAAFDNHFYALQLRTLFWSIAGILSALIKIPLT
jgi:O-antigen ligase